MSRLPSALLCLLLSTPALSPAAENPPPQEQVIATWLQKAANLPPMELTFVQERQLRALKRPLVREGTLWLGKGGQIRWQIDAPPSRILVHDGGSDQVLLFDEMQKTVQRLSLDDPDQGTETATLKLLMDSRSLTLDAFKQIFTLRGAKQTDAERNLWDVELDLNDRKASFFVTKVLWTIEPDEGILHRMAFQLRDTSSLATRITAFKPIGKQPADWFSPSLEGYTLLEK